MQFLVFWGLFCHTLHSSNTLSISEVVFLWRFQLRIPPNRSQQCPCGLPVQCAVSEGVSFTMILHISFSSAITPPNVQDRGCSVSLGLKLLARCGRATLDPQYGRGEWARNKRLSLQPSPSKISGRFISPVPPGVLTNDTFLNLVLHFSFVLFLSYFHDCCCFVMIIIMTCLAFLRIFWGCFFPLCPCSPPLV